MKTRGPLWKISISTNAEAEDAVTELLYSWTEQNPSSYTDVETGEVTVAIYLSETSMAHVQRSAAFMPLQGGKLRDVRTLKRHKCRAPNTTSGRIQLVAALRMGLARIKNCGLNVGSAKISIRKVRREDWAESWKRHFKPIEIGTALLIKPSWSKRPARKGQAVIVLDPGLSFGTGQHPTTSFCLRQLADRCARDDKSKASFLDIGTGSGILAIAAAKLGYSPVHAFDFDPEAVRIARGNARKNCVTARLRITRGDVTKIPARSARKYDLICANLISTLLMAERRRIIARLKPGGTLVLAGILDREFSSVQRGYEKAGFRLIASRREKEWRSGSFTFR